MTRRSLKSPKRTSRLRSYTRVLSLRLKRLQKRRREARTANMKRKMMGMVRKTMMRRVAISGDRKAATGTGITRRTRRLMSVEIPCQTLLTHPYSSTAKQSKR